MGFNFKKAEPPKKLNRDFILSKITDAQIFRYYFGNFKFNECYPSKLRPDKHPSTGFYVSKSGKLIYNDLARRGENYDCFAFVAKLYNMEFSDVIKKIAADFGLISGKPALMAEKAINDMKNFDKTFKADTMIQFEAGKWDDNSLAFWKAYHLDKKDLRDEGIYNINTLYVNGYAIPKKDGEYRYALTQMVKGQMRTKVYSPGSSNFKWVTNIPTEVPFGIDSIKCTSDFSFTTKAQKCRLVLKKFLPNVIAAQSEQRSAMPEKVIKKLNFNYERNYIGWDPDETGLEAMEDMAQDGFIPAHVPVNWYERYAIKDYSDLAKEKGLGAVEQLLKKHGIV